jgi:FkbM family methyltransferase
MFLKILLCILIIVIFALIVVIVGLRDPDSATHKALFSRGMGSAEPETSSEPIGSATQGENAITPISDPFDLVRGRHGHFLVNRHDMYMGQALLQYGECCESEVQSLNALIDASKGTVLEVGTNIGTHTIPLAKRLAKEQRNMIVFEPQPFIFQNLCANLALNVIQNVRAWPFAVGARMDEVFFDKQDYVATSNSNAGGVSMHEDFTGGQIGVPCIRLDDFIEGESIGVMKIDVEGFEVQVLIGAEKLIEACHPLISIENDRPAQSKELIEWLWAHEYDCWWHIPHLYSADNYFSNHTNIYNDIASFNMICIHRLSEIKIESIGIIDRIVLVTDSNIHPLQKAQH